MVYPYCKDFGYQPASVCGYVGEWLQGGVRSGLPAPLKSDCASRTYSAPGEADLGWGKAFPPGRY